MHTVNVHDADFVDIDKAALTEKDTQGHVAPFSNPNNHLASVSKSTAFMGSAGMQGTIPLDMSQAQAVPLELKYLTDVWYPQSWHPSCLMI
jgi:hypothetical protein